VSNAVIIQCAVTGSVDADAERRPNLPSTPAQIIDSAVEAWNAGASVLHLHAREADGTPTQNPGAYRQLVDGIRERGCDAVLNLSCGTAGGRSFEDARYEVVTELAPELASFDCGTINFGERIFEGSVPFLRRMADAFKAAGTAAEIECFDTGHIGLALQLHNEGLLPGPLRIQLVVGIAGSGVPVTPSQIEHMRAPLPANSLWSICAPGAHQLAVTLHCLAWGGHVRTGLEDNLFLHRGERASNAQLVERMARLAEEVGRPVASPGDARQLLHLV
jgi:3-keto-5-aminohexanoate cleavage enzyme